MTVRLAVVVRVNPLLVPVTVMSKVELDDTESVALTVRVVELPAAMEVEPRVHVRPEGQVPPSLRLTVPVNPFRAFAVIV